MEEEAAATVVITKATRGLALRRTSRYSAAKMVDTSTMLNNTTACNPPKALSLAKRTSLSHSHANQGAPGLVKEKTSRNGTHPWAMIHSPVRMCQPVSQSPSIVVAPSMCPNKYRMGMRNTKSASDGRNLTAIFERASIFSASQALSGHPRTGGRPDGFISSNPVVERPEIHIVDAQGNKREFLGGTGNPHDRALTVDAFLANHGFGQKC